MCIYLYIVEISTLSTRITISIGLVSFYHVYFKKEPEGNSSYRVSNSRAWARNQIARFILPYWNTVIVR